MEELTKTEERIMQVMWQLKQAFVKDLLQHLPDTPKPPYTTISSVVRILERKGFLGYKAYGKTHEYFPLVSEAQYRDAKLQHLLPYFNNSPSALVTHLVEEVLNRKELQLLRKLLDEA